MVSELIKSIEDSSKQVKESFGGLSEAQLNWKPAQDKWSAGECIEHLIVTNKAYFPVLEKIITGTHKNSFWQKFSPLSGVWGRLLLKTVSPGTERKAKTANIFLPVSSTVPKTIISDFIKTNDEFVSYLKKLGSIYLKKTKIYSPVSKFITYSLLDAIKIITFHEVRHINQAKRVMEMEGFPGS
jgi:hypothetical protein